ncbi:glycosyltransferase family 4 protein [Hamadaea tsunoensis]|uniref:glycosyltransferase family 4 protein n=1 Tax=Hamadaea tsunoensis TaxID=53368 RepID=UPI000423D843|nr:glycosyltransferase family 4 protein [Hamadaea tsunoensis]
MTSHSGARGAVILGGGGIRVPGGLAMRWRALRDALARHAPTTFRELGCDRWAACERVCVTSGVSARTHNVAVTGGKVWFNDRTFCDEYARWLADDLAESGVGTIVCSGLDTYRYVAALAATGRFHVVFDLHNVETVLHRQIVEQMPPGSPYAGHYTEDYARRVAVAERTAVQAADAVWVCSPDDRDLAVATFGVPAAKVRVAPNVVPVTGTAVPPNRAERISFTGRIDWFPNIGAGRALIDEIAPLLIERGIEVPVVIAGMMARELLDGPDLPPTVRLVSAPRQIADIVADSVLAVPLTLGGGSRFKVLEAFAAGAPVVSTAKGVEGLGLEPGRHYLAAEKPAEFADALAVLLTDAAVRARLAGAGWDLVRTRYSIDALADTLAGSLPR